MSAPERLSVAGIAAAVHAGATTALAVAHECLERIAAYDAIQPQIWIGRPTPEALLEQAAAIDARVAAGEHLPLAGVPFAVKDNIDAQGLPTSAACPAFSYMPAHDSTAVARLRAAVRPR